MSEAPELIKEHRYILKDPFPYGTKAGEQDEATFIVLKAPTSRNSRECATLKQAFFRAVDRPDEGSKKGGDDEEGDLSNIQGGDVIMTMAMSQNVSLPDVMDTGHYLFTKGNVAFVEGETPLTKPLLALMSQDDVEEMLGAYLVFFTLASSLQRMKTKSSKVS